KFDVKVTPVAYRMRVTLATHRVTVYKDGAVFFRGPIRVAAAQAAHAQPGRFYLRRIELARSVATTASPYAYRFVAKLANRVPLGTVAGCDDLIGVLVQRELQTVEPHVDPVGAHAADLAAQHVGVEGPARLEIAHRDRHVEDWRDARHAGSVGGTH